MSGQTDDTIDFMRSNASQLHLNIPEFILNENQESEKIPIFPNGRANKLADRDRPIHDWYRFVLSFPPHLVQEYIKKFGLNQKSVVMDPFCGTGTTLIEARLAGMKSVGIEANYFPQFAASVKVDWSVDPDLFLSWANLIADETRSILKAQGMDDDLSFSTNLANITLLALQPEAAGLLLKDSISPLPLHKTLVLLEQMSLYKEKPFFRHALLALANALVYKISNLHFGPEVGVQNPKADVPVISNWLLEVRKIAHDLRLVQGKQYPEAEVYLADARDLSNIFPDSINAVITSPPYPNEKDYTRTTRLESVLLGFIKNKEELQELKKGLVRSNTRGVYKGDDDDTWISESQEIQRIANDIETRRIEMGKNSGFEKQYGKVTKLYFGGMARHLSEMRKVLRPGAQLAYVVGDQASYLRVMIHTGQLLGEIAKSLGYELMGIELFRTRLSTTTKEQLREEVVLLRWKG